MDTQEQIAELEEQLSIALTALSNHVDTVIEQDAKIAELEARLAQASRWAPAADGRYDAVYEMTYIVVSGSWLRVCNGYGVCADVELPDSIRLCRREEPQP